MSLFNLDLNKVSQQIAPRILWLDPLKAFVGAFLAPILSQQSNFNDRRAEDIYRLEHNSQVVYLEAVLNDTFDNSLRRIRIVDPVEIDSTYVYLHLELKPKYIYKTSEANSLYIRKTEETVLGGPDFIVEVPSVLAFDIAHLRALVNEYRLASKSFFTIVTV